MRSVMMDLSGTTFGNVSVDLLVTSADEVRSGTIKLDSTAIGVFSLLSDNMRVCPFGRNVSVAEGSLLVGAIREALYRYARQPHQPRDAG